MKVLRRILLVVGVLLLLLVVVGGVIFTKWLRDPFPQTAGTLPLAGLQDEVTIYRDDLGIPHIYAQNEHDLFYAQGFVHAQDRFWQMEFFRHIGSGRISEITGPASIETDSFIRTLGWNRVAEFNAAYYEQNEPEAWAVLQAYADGVNAYIEQNRDNLSFNNSLLQVVRSPREIEPWTPKNSLSWAVVMSYDLSGNYEDEITRVELAQLLGEEKMRELIPPYPGNRPVIVPTSEQLQSALPRNGAEVAWAQVNTALIGSVPEAGFALGAGDFVGSNSWVVNGEKSETGAPLLANDPHLGMQMPSIWYQVGLHAPGIDATGFSFAGTPGLPIGHNNAIAWGQTTSNPDVQDLYIEKINPDNPNQYEYMGQWEEMTVITEVIKVNGGEDVLLPVRITRHGPIITEQYENLDQSQPLALRWSLYGEPHTLLKSVYLLLKAQNFEEFRTAMSLWDMPSQNTIYADTNGNIGYQMNGRIPIRPHDGSMPVPGWTGEYEWQGWIPFEEQPALYNPEQGYIVTANNAVVDREYAYPIGDDWDNGDRAQRLTTMMEAALAEDGKVGIADYQAMQYDSQSLLAMDYLPLLATLQSENATTQAALDALKGWDGQLRRDSTPAVIWEIFNVQLARALLADEYEAALAARPPTPVAEAEEGEEAPTLEEEALGYIVNNGATRILLHKLADDSASALWDDVSTSAPETREQILLQAMDGTVAYLTETIGGNQAEWQWGDLHQSLYVSNPLGQSDIGPVEAVVNRGPFPTDGGSSVPNANGWSWANPSRVTGHVSMRMIVDFNDFANSLAIHATGQSGHPSHPHYDDMIPMWIAGEYAPLRWGDADIQASAVDTLTLTPSTGN